MYAPIGIIYLSDRKYPLGKFITLADLEMTLDDALYGLSYETDPLSEAKRLDVKHTIISKDIECNTVFF
ncbi:MAG TPA: hypothetical protein VMV49_18330 [Candidatus Deferrimicrobium sp.]|nr:hypothetical protein [Candidatus Deferrimicrobium sp.]